MSRTTLTLSVRTTIQLKINGTDLVFLKYKHLHVFFDPNLVFVSKQVRPPPFFLFLDITHIFKIRVHANLPAWL